MQTQLPHGAFHPTAGTHWTLGIGIREYHTRAAFTDEKITLYRVMYDGGTVGEVIKTRDGQWEGIPWSGPEGGPLTRARTPARERQRDAAKDVVAQHIAATGVCPVCRRELRGGDDYPHQDATGAECSFRWASSPY